MKKTYTVISFGNYETKILISNFIDGEIYPIYKKSFLTKNCYDNSKLIDKDLLLKILEDNFKKIPIDVRKTKIIFNLPVKKLEIQDYISNEFIIRDNFTKNKWLKIWNSSKKNNFKKSLIEIDSKCYSSLINSQETWPIPFDKYIEKFSFRSKHYFIETSIINSYLEIAKKLLISVNSIVCDSLVMNKLFSNPNKRYKLLLNVGHAESSFELYDNYVLIRQETIGFGIKNLTSKICEFASIDEQTSIELLKIYRDLAPIDKDLPLVNHFKEKFMDYSQTKINDISAIIVKWLEKLISRINGHISTLNEKSIEIDEIYIYSSTNIFKTWVDYIKKELYKFVNIICLESNFIGVDESKFISLVASMIYFHQEINN